MTWRGSSVQCSTCSTWVHLRCSLLSLSRFKTLGSFHSWSCPFCYIPASFGDTNTVISSSDSSNLYTSNVLPGSSGLPLLMQRSRHTLAFKPLISFSPISYLLSLHPHHPLMFLDFFYTSASSSSPDSFKVLQWNAGALRAMRTKLLNFISSHSINLICIQESNLKLSFSFRFPGFSALRSDCTHYRSGILSPNTTHASGGFIIFVRQGFSFSELSTFSLSSLDPYFDYVGFKISLNNSSSLSFLNVSYLLFSDK